jgi:hypothetical protein
MEKLLSKMEVYLLLLMAVVLALAPLNTCWSYHS